MRSKILVVDDDENILHAFHDLLTKEGFQDIPARNGADALQTFVKERPCLIFLDLHLQDMHGFELFKRIRQLDNDTHIIVLADDEIEPGSLSEAKDAFDFLAKPLSVFHIREAIEKALTANENTSHDMTDGTDRLA
jgi:two-component system cell cycle response regulator DivK